VSFIDVIENSRILIAIVVYGALALGEPVYESRLQRIFRSRPASPQFWDALFAPSARALLFTAFVFVIYPDVFGLHTAPSLGTLISGRDAPVAAIPSAFFVAAYAVSLVPALARRPEIVLPLQGCLAGAFLFSRLTAYLGITTAVIWPGIDVFLSMLLVIYFGVKIRRALIGRYTDARGFGYVLISGSELLIRIGVVLLFAYGLGRQLAI